MKTSYKILWVDDEERYVNDWRHEVEDLLEEYGIHAEIYVAQTPGDEEATSIQQEIESYLVVPEVFITG